MSSFGKGKSLFGKVSTNNCKNSLPLRKFFPKEIFFHKSTSYEEDKPVFHEQKGLHFDLRQSRLIMLLSTKWFLFARNAGTSFSYKHILVKIHSNLKN